MIPQRTSDGPRDDAILAEFAGGVEIGCRDQRSVSDQGLGGGKRVIGGGRGEVHHHEARSGAVDRNLVSRAGGGVEAQSGRQKAGALVVVFRHAAEGGE